MTKPLVDNSCTCTHHRSKHFQAKNGDVTVISKCEETGCKCQQFKKMKSEFTPVQMKYTLVGTIVFISIIVSGAIGIAMVNGSVDDSHDSYYKIWKGDVDNFKENFASYYEGNGTLSDVEKYLDMNTNEFEESANASGVVIPVVIAFLLLLFVLLVMYDKERKEELLL